MLPTFMLGLPISSKALKTTPSNIFREVGGEEKERERGAHWLTWSRQSLTETLLLADSGLWRANKMKSSQFLNIDLLFRFQFDCELAVFT